MDASGENGAAPSRAAPFRVVSQRAESLCRRSQSVVCPSNMLPLRCIAAGFHRGGEDAPQRPANIISAGMPAEE